jgi:toxin ParE1/3/4
VRRLVYLSAARDDLGDILRYVTRQSASLATGNLFVSKLRQHCAHLASLPGTLGTARPELRDDLRSTPCHGYVIFFR